jgi:hypothetical protein
LLLAWLFIISFEIAELQIENFAKCDADANYLPPPVSSQSEWPEDEPLVEDSNMNNFRDELAHALFHGL